MLKRLGDLIGFIRGDFIVLKIKDDALVVEAKNFKKEKLQEVASTFFQKVYSLSETR